MILYHRCLKNNQCFSNLFVSSWFIEISLLYETIDADSVFKMYFRISVTFEMRTTEYSEIYISIDTHTIAERVYKGEETVGKESKVSERQRERVCVCEC